jgi:hypothetical protein
MNLATRLHHLLSGWRLPPRPEASQAPPPEPADLGTAWGLDASLRERDPDDAHAPATRPEYHPRRN